MANTNDFFGNLGKTLSETAKTVGEKTDEFIAIQKLRSQQNTLENEVKKNFKDVGEMIYQRFIGGEAFPEEISEICQEIMKLQSDIAECRETIAAKKGFSVCPACGANVPKESAFCMKCGSPMPEPDKEPEDAVYEETEDSEEEDSAEETVTEEDASTADPVDASAEQEKED
ncbi:MAG: zinc ribbon domain-containing protein [Lachnospiraceae bacterium]|nr:zinc ribbon domain-containing protein [Lachnospiraceae bacterium]